MAVFLYVEQESPLHRLHPVTKVIGLLLGFAISLMFSHPLPALGALMIAVVGLWAAGGLTNVARVWKFLAILFVMTTVIWSLFLRVGEKGGEAAWAVELALPQVTIESIQMHGKPLQFGGGNLKIIEASPITVEYGIAMALRIVACLIFGLTFLSCTRIEDFALGLRHLGAPHGASVAVSLAFRLVPTLVMTARNVIEAQRARGVEPAAGNVFRRVRNYIPLITPVLAYALRGADLTAMALESRGLGRAPAERTHYRAFRTGLLDWLLVVGLVVVVVLCIVARLYGYGTISFGPQA